MESAQAILVDLTDVPSALPHERPRPETSLARTDNQQRGSEPHERDAVGGYCGEGGDARARPTRSISEHVAGDTQNSRETEASNHGHDGRAEDGSVIEEQVNPREGNRGVSPLSAEQGGAAAGAHPLYDSTNTLAAPSPAAAAAAAIVGVNAPKCDMKATAKRKKRKIPQTTKSPEGDGERCSICLDPWTSKGKHRICTLLCGHLFGQSCIERWLLERRSCPQCGAKVGSKGSKRVIPLFLSNLVAKDTGDLETVQKLFDQEKRLRKQCEAERVRLSIQNASLKEQLSRLRRADSSTTAHSQQGRTVGHGQAFAGQRRAKLAGFLTPERFSPAAASSSTPGASSGASSIVHGAGICSRSPLLRHSPSLQRKPGSSTGPSVDSGTVGVIGGRSLGGSEGAGRSTGSSSITANQGTLPGAMHGAMIERKPAAQFEPLLTQELKGGRVAAFAGGAAGAFLVSQDFGVVGLSSGPCRHGVTKFSLADLRHQRNIRLHREPVRDIKFSTDAGSSTGCVLSTSFDRTLKVCDLRTDSVVVDYELEGNGWSCQWSATRSNQMFCGIVDGCRTAAVLLFDLRSTRGAIRKLRAAASQRQPVHSICHTEDDHLLCATMGGVWAWGAGTNTEGGSTGVKNGDEEGQTAERLQIQGGACCSLSQAGDIRGSTDGASRRRFLVSTRGAAASHAVFGLEAPTTADSASVTDGGSEVHRTIEASEEIVPREDEQDAKIPRAGGVRCDDRVDALTDDRTSENIGSCLTGSGSADAQSSRQTRLVSWAGTWKQFPGVAQGHQSQRTLSRALLWDPFLSGKWLIAGGDERTNQPCVWDASTGQVCNRLSAHRSPVLDVASFQASSASCPGLFAAVSQSEMRVYRSSLR